MKLIWESQSSATSQTQSIQLNGASFSIGSGLDDDVSLPGLALAGHRIAVTVNGAQLKFKTSKDLKKDGELLREGVWSVDEAFYFGPHKIVLLSIDDNTVKLFIQLFEAPTYLDGINPLNQKHQTWLSVRKASYIGIVAVLFFGLILPVTFHYYQKGGGDAERWLGSTDQFWTSGPLANAHQNPGIDGNCQACHTDLWVQVKDESCLTCHADITAHGVFEPHANAGMKPERCASCHKEHMHNKEIISFDSAGCIDCHSKPSLWAENPHEVKSVARFSAQQHPDFDLNMWVFDENLWRSQSVPPSPDLVETSNLKFSHKTHLNTAQVTNNGLGLDCASCHVLDRDSDAHFEPITMEANCMSCHTLGIDIEDDQRQLPHGEPAAVVRALEEYLSYQYINPRFRQNREQLHVRTRAVPGKPMIKTTFNMSPCKQLDKVFDCVKDEVEELSILQFEFGGCVTCHEVASDPSQNLAQRWQILPVRLQSDWFPRHNFDHKAHLSGEVERATQYCLSCHQATSSDVSDDILIPNIQNCLQCHSQDDARSVKMDCLSCHQFHLSDTPKMSTVRAQ